MTRWSYLRLIVNPAAMVLWELEGTGLRADRRARWKHARRLRRREVEIKKSLLATPIVATAIAERTEVHATQLRVLEVARAYELEQANAPREEWERRREEVQAARARGDRSVTIKSLGKAPPLARKSSLTKSVASMRNRVEMLQGGMNPGSWQQKAWLLYEVCGLPTQRDKDSGRITTDKKALARLARHERALGNAEIAATIAGLKEHEHVNQILTTFVRVKLDAGRIKSLYGLHRTATGRVASGADTDEKAGEAATNQQNWPVEVRDIVIPEEGNLLVQVDWSRVEWLLTLMFAHDEEGWARALAGEDQHRRLAASIFRVAYEDITIEQRTHAKRATHGLNYGMGPQNLADTMGVSFAEAKRVIQAFQDAFPLVAKWRGEVVEKATKQHYLETPFGWRRWFWRKDPPEMIAFLPSATGADMLKARLAPASAAAKKVGGRLLTTTHDSVLAECWHQHAEPLAMALKEVFERPFRHLDGRSFPAETKIGVNWKECS